MPGNRHVRFGGGGSKKYHQQTATRRPPIPHHIYSDRDICWLYLTVILDLYSRVVVGWSMSAYCDEALVANAFHMALARRRPKPGLLHHSD